MLKNWNQNKAPVELIKLVGASAGNPSDGVICVAKGGATTFTRGTYVHPKLAPHIASWISPKVGMIVADIVNNNQIAEYQAKIAAQQAEIEGQQTEIAK